MPRQSSRVFKDPTETPAPRTTAIEPSGRNRRIPRTGSGSWQHPAVDCRSTLHYTAPHDPSDDDAQRATAAVSPAGTTGHFRSRLRPESSRIRRLQPFRTKGQSD